MSSWHCGGGSALSQYCHVPATLITGPCFFLKSSHGPLLSSEPVCWTSACRPRLVTLAATFS